jgi:hypothetical protein
MAGNPTGAVIGRGLEIETAAIVVGGRGHVVATRVAHVDVNLTAMDLIAVGRSVEETEPITRMAVGNLTNQGRREVGSHAATLVANGISLGHGAIIVRVAVGGAIEPTMVVVVTTTGGDVITIVATVITVMAAAVVGSGTNRGHGEVTITTVGVITTLGLVAPASGGSKVDSAGFLSSGIGSQTILIGLLTAEDSNNNQEPNRYPTIMVGIITDPKGDSGSKPQRREWVKIVKRLTVIQVEDSGP